MSTVFYNLITLTGERDAVRAVCRDGRRPISGKLSKSIGTRQIDWSFERLFQLHPALSGICGAPPSDEWHYGASAGTVSGWGRFPAASRNERRWYSKAAADGVFARLAPPVLPAPAHEAEILSTKDPGTLPT